MYAHLVMLSETVMPHCERPRAHSLNFDKPSRGRGGYFLFDLIFIKKKIKKKIKPVQIDCFGLVWFFRKKTISNPFGSVFFVWLDFSGLARFFFVWGRFGFFSFRLIKPNRTDRFFQNFNRFFSRFGFFSYFFSGFLSFLGFSVFFSPLLSKTIITYKILKRI